MNPIQNFLRSYDYHIVLQYWNAPIILQGLVLTIVLAVLAQFIGTVLGLLLYFMRRTRFQPVRWVAEVYIWFFRGTPLIVQVLGAYLMVQYLGFGRPLRAIDIFNSIGFLGDTTDGFIAGLAALALNEGAYMSEIVRAGIEAIDSGQLEAAKSLGMTYWQGMRRIVLPQAMRVIIPPLGNEFNSMLKSTSLVAYSSMYELLGAAQFLGGRLFKSLELLTVAVFWYLVLTTIWTIFQVYLERRFNASTRDPGAAKPFWQRFSLSSLWTANRPVPGVAAPDVPVGARRA